MLDQVRSVLRLTVTVHVTVPSLHELSDCKGKSSLLENRLASGIFMRPHVFWSVPHTTCRHASHHTMCSLIGSNTQPTSQTRCAAADFSLMHKGHPDRHPGDPSAHPVQGPPPRDNQELSVPQWALLCSRGGSRAAHGGHHCQCQ